MSFSAATWRVAGNSISAGSQPTSPLGHLAHFQPLKGLMSQAPGRTSRSRSRAPATSSMAFDPVGRSLWRYGRLYKMSGTGTTSTGGNDDCADPCRPSIQATSRRANSQVTRVHLTTLVTALRWFMAGLPPHLKKRATADATRARTGPRGPA
jgi:hypothetical protein